MVTIIKASKIKPYTIKIGYTVYGNRFMYLNGLIKLKCENQDF